MIPTCPNCEGLESVIEPGGSRRFCFLMLYSTSANRERGRNWQGSLLQTTHEYSCRDYSGNHW